MFFNFFKKKKKYEIGDFIQFNNNVYCIVNIDNNFMSIIDENGKIYSQIYYINKNIKILNKLKNKIYKLDKSFIKTMIKDIKKLIGD